MRKKVFKYQLIYWIAIFVNIVIFYFYLTMLYSVVSSSFLDSKHIIAILLGFLISIFSVICFIGLIKKHRLAHLMYSILLILVMISILNSIFEAVYYKDLKNGYTSEDYVLSYSIYLLFFGLLFLVVYKYKFRAKPNLEIEEIGKHKE